MISDSSSPLKVGLVGLGVLSQRSVLPHLMLPDAQQVIELRAVCDIDDKRAHQVAEQYGVPEQYSSLDDMLNTASIEAVLICTPIHAHHSNALAALSAGKHVYVQKTLALNARDAQEILAEARRRDLVLVASPEQMLNPARLAARRMLSDGAIGPVYWAFCPTDYPGPEGEQHRQGEQPFDRIDPTWYYRPGGGPVLNMTVYALHTLTGLLGPVKRVNAMSGVRQPTRRWKDHDIAVQVDDNTLLQLDFGAGVFAIASGSAAYPGRGVGWGHLCLYGTTGAMEVYAANPREPNLASVVELVGGETYHFNDFGPYLPPDHAQLGDPHVYADIRHFAECVAGGQRPYGYAAQAVHVIEVIEKGYLAARLGQPQTIERTFEL